MVIIWVLQETGRNLRKEVAISLSKLRILDVTIYTKEVLDYDNPKSNEEINKWRERIKENPRWYSPAEFEMHKRKMVNNSFNKKEVFYTTLKYDCGRDEILYFNSLADSKEAVNKIIQAKREFDNVK